MVGGDHVNLPEFFAGDSDIEYDYYDIGHWIGQSNAGAGVNNCGDIDEGEESEESEQSEESDDEDSDDDSDDEEQQNEQENGDEDSDDDSDDEEQQNEQENGDEDSDDDSDDEEQQNERESGDEDSDDETEDTVPYSDDDEEASRLAWSTSRECLTQADYTNLSSFIRSMLLFSFRTLGDALLSFPAYCDIDPASILQLPSDEADKIYINIYNRFYDPRDAEEDFFENRAVFGLQALADQLQMQMQV
jgi:hypothetical protein